MEIIRGLHNIRNRHRGSVCTLGNFDGVHAGHASLLRVLQEQAANQATSSMAITFEPQPREYFRGKLVPARLTRFREKVELISELEISYLLCLPFNEQLQSTTAEDLIENYLVRTLGIQNLVVGQDFRFGKDAAGDVTLLQRASTKHGFSVTCVSPFEYGGSTISSTRVREALESGDFAKAEAMLKRNYFMMGPVVAGNRFGSNIGIPTANIRLQRYRSPLEGIFAVRIQGLEREYYGAAYVGTRPTIGGIEPLLEVHIFKLDRDLYGSQLKIQFLKKFRSDRMFETIDKLRVQMEADLALIHAWLHTKFGLGN